MTKTPKQIRDEMNAVMGGPMIRMGNDPSLVVKYLSTGVLPIDVLLGGGIPRGRATELFGAYSSLKSYIAYRCIAETQRQGLVAGLVDTEGAYDPEWAEFCGINTKDLLLPPIENGEMAVDATELLVRSGAALVVWDSVAATLPKAEQEKSLANDKLQPGRQAALFSAALRKLTAANSDTALLFINQTRMNIGVTFGSPETTPGGKAVPFYASYRLRMVKMGKINSTTVAYDGQGTKISASITRAMKIKAVLDKSKLNAPHREVHFAFDLENGVVDEVGYLVSLGVESGEVKVTNKSYYALKGSQKRTNGRENFKRWLADNPTTLAKLKEKVLPTEPPGDAAPAKRKVARRRKTS